MATFIHGSDSTITLDGQTLTTVVDSVALDQNVALHSVTSLGDNSEESISGLKSWSVQVAGSYSAVEDALIFAMFDGSEIAVSFVLGGVTYSGNGFLESYNTTNPVGDKVAWSGTVKGNGDLGRA
jgi:hypothetical protein